MKRLITIALILGIAATTLALAQAPRSIEAQFKAAQHAEEVEGDLKKAIEQYREITRSGDRAVAARALIRMAECHQKLGDAEAKKIYERIVRDFADQKDAVVTARARLESQKVGRARLTTERVLDVAGMSDSLSPDGRYVARPNHTTGNLVLLELKTGAMRPLTSDGRPDDPDHRFPLASVFSRDGRYVAYAWYLEIKDESMLRVIATDAAEGKGPRTLFENPDVDLTPMDWSPDGQWVAVIVEREDRTKQIGVVRVADGSLTPLKTVDWSKVGGLRFSPDSSKLAYHRPPVEGAIERDVFVINVDGSREIALTSSSGDDTVVDWTPDGQRLLVASDRSGSNSLWSIAASGDAALPFELVKSDIGIIGPLGLTRDGALFYQMLPARPGIYTATFDTTTGQLVPGSVQALQQFKGFAFSPQFVGDGKSLAYVSRREVSATTGNVLMTLKTDTGDVHEVRPPLSYGNFPKWFPDGRHVLLYGQDLKGRPGIFKVDNVTGDVVLTIQRDTCNLPFLSSDGQSIFCHAMQQKQLRQLDASSGAVMRTLTIDGQPYAASPDGQFVVTSSLETIALNTGEKRSLFQLSPPSSQVGNSFTIAWTPDSRGVVFYGRVRGDDGMWRVSLDGGPPQKIHVNVGPIVSWRFHPTTGQVAFSTNGVGPRLELWKMENFLPSNGTK